MTSDSNLILALIIVTFVAALAFGIYQWRKSRKAQQEHKHSSVGDIRDLPPRPAAPTAKPENRRA